MHFKNNEMQKLFSLFCLLVIMQIIQAAPVDSAEAAKIALNFYKQNNVANVVNGLPVREAKPDKNFRNITSATTFKNFYIFNADDGGFVIVSADDRAVPVLGYSDNGFINAGNLPENFKWWLGEYEREIDYAIVNDIAADEVIKEEWAALRAGQPIPLREAKGVAPLLQTHWGQDPYYNVLCPYDAIAEEYTVTGCVATAMAQIMKYWEYPAVGQGSHVYFDNNFGAQYADFATNLFWNNMPDQLDATSSYMQVYSVAKLMRLCGVGVDMGYGIPDNGGSGASPSYVPNALIGYFDYSPNTKSIFQSNYSNSAWQDILKNELNNGRPVLYSGTDPNNGGHAFVCDGVNNSNDFHFNWGWRGSSDGYFAINALNPDDCDFSTKLSAVIGIEPAHPIAKPTYDLVMNSTLSTDSSTYSFGENVIVTRDIKNSGTTAFNGYVKIMLRDMNDNIVDSKLDYVTIPANGTHSSSVTFNGYAPLVPGNYYIMVCSMTDKDDISTLRLVRDDKSHQNFAQIEIQNTGSIETYSPFTCSALDSGKSATVSVNLENNTDSAFTGTVALVIADLSGNIEQYIGQESISNLSAYSTYTVSYTNTIAVSSGEHLLMLIYIPSGSSGWYYAGNSYYDNPVRIYVNGTPYPDKYEANDDASAAYDFGFGNVDYIRLDIDANFHNSTDKDYYKISLPDGYAHIVSMVVFDNGNFGSDLFSVNAKFAISADGNAWTSEYDSARTIVAYGDSVLYFRVLPYATGDIGTYRFNIEILRAVQPDNYEENNTEMTAYTLGTVNSDDTAIVVKATFHIESDEDFYKVILPAGYDYTVNATLYTSFNSSYTVDAKFATSDDGVNWSENYDSQMPEMTVSDGDTVYFHVFLNSYELGIYKLVISVQRKGVGISETENAARWTLYPNPAIDVLNISAPDAVESYTLDLLAIDGKLIRKYYGEVSSINVSDLPSGIYFVRFVNDKNVVIRKWVK